MSEPGILPQPIPFGKYYLLERINVGGMAEVYKAKAFGVEGFERLLAVKKILASIAEDEAFINMFIDEAKIAGQLNHPNIAQIFDLGKVDGSYFIALEYIGGKDLKTIFERARRLGEKVSIPRVCYIIMKAAEGLAHAHHKQDAQGRDLNIVHRDVSPQNILMSYEGEVKIIDFGIAKASGKTSQTQVGILKGKFSYMSPEQVRGLHVDNRSDVFSLGIVFYELLTLERLFLGESDFDTLEKIRKVEMSPPSLYNPHIPKDLEDIVLKSLAKSPEDRYQTAYEFAEALEQFMRNQGFYYTNKDIAIYMKEAFNADIEFENKKLEYYRSLNLQPIEETSEASAPPARQAGLSWGEEEMETQIFDRDDEIGDDDILREVLDHQSTMEHERWDNKSFDDAPLGRPGRVPQHTAKVQSIGPPPTTVHTTKQSKRRYSGLVIFVVALLVLLLGFAVFWNFLREDKATLRVATQPEVVEVWVNGQKVFGGTTPYEMELDSGPSKIELRAEGYEPYIREEQLSANQQYNLNQTLTKMIEAADVAPTNNETVLIKTNPPGATVTINGKAFGDKSPFTFTGLGDGPFEIQIAKDGYFPETKTVTVLPKDAIDVRLKPKKVAVTIRSTPTSSNYVIFEKGSKKQVKRGRTSDTVKDLDASKSYRIVVRRPDFRNWEDVFEPGFEAENRIEAKLVKRDERADVIEPPKKKDPKKKDPKKKDPKIVKKDPVEKPTGTGTLSIQSKPAARVYIDGKDTGRYTPIMNFKLKAGKHKIKLINPDFGLSKVFYRTITPGKKHKLVNK